MSAHRTHSGSRRTREWEVGDIAILGGATAEMTGEPYEIEPGVWWAEFRLESGDHEEHALAPLVRLCVACNAKAQAGGRLGGNWLCRLCLEDEARAGDPDAA